MNTTHEGQDDKGRLHGHAAVTRLLDSIPGGPTWNRGKAVNPWDAADDAVEQADDETVRAALRRLLALHIFDLQGKHPQVAMRNLKVGDVVLIGGARRRVTELLGQGNIRTAHPRRPDDIPGYSGYFSAGSPNVHIDLVERPAANHH